MQAAVLSLAHHKDHPKELPSIALHPSPGSTKRDDLPGYGKIFLPDNTISQTIDIGRRTDTLIYSHSGSSYVTLEGKRVIGRSEVVDGKWCKAVASSEEIEVHSHDGDGEVTTIAKFAIEKNYLDIPVGPQGLHPITLNGELFIVAVEPPKEDVEGNSQDESKTRFRVELPDNTVENSEFKLKRLVLQGKGDDFLSDDTPIAYTTWKKLRGSAM